jgi:Alpha/beta hydrolase family
VLVHGAYADGSSWSAVIQRLQGAGLAVTAVQNPLTSLAHDVAHTRRILALHQAPVILAGHSFAGTVISQAGTDPRVAGLVYIAARAPPTRARTTLRSRRGSRHHPPMPGLSTPITAGLYIALLAMVGAPITTGSNSGAPI